MTHENQTLPADHPASRAVPTLIYNSRAWVPAVDYDRLHVALERILNHGETHDEPCWAIHNGDCADTMQELARAALAEDVR